MRRNSYDKSGEYANYVVERDGRLLEWLLENVKHLSKSKIKQTLQGRGVKVGKDVKIRNSIIMQKCDIQDGALVENVICDKNVVITKGRWLKGAPNYPLIVSKNAVV